MAAIDPRVTKTLLLSRIDGNSSRLKDSLNHYTKHYFLASSEAVSNLFSLHINNIKKSRDLNSEYNWVNISKKVSELLAQKSRWDETAFKLKDDCDNFARSNATQIDKRDIQLKLESTKFNTLLNQVRLYEKRILDNYLFYHENLGRDYPILLDTSGAKVTLMERAKEGLLEHKERVAFGLYSLLIASKTEVGAHALETSTQIASALTIEPIKDVAVLTASGVFSVAKNILPLLSFSWAMPKVYSNLKEKKYTEAMKQFLIGIASAALPVFIDTTVAKTIDPNLLPAVTLPAAAFAHRKGYTKIALALLGATSLPFLAQQPIPTTAKS